MATDVIKTIGPGQDFTNLTTWDAYLDGASAFLDGHERGQIVGDVAQGGVSATFATGSTSPTQNIILESGAAGKHEGVYDLAKNHITHSNHLLFIQDAYVIVQDIQTEQTGAFDWGIVVQPTVESFITVRRNLLGLNRPATIRSLLECNPNHADAVFDVYRNVLWWLLDIGGAGRSFNAVSTINNNTIWGNNDTCFQCRSKVFELHNNIAQNSSGSDSYRDATNTNHSANISDDELSPDAAFRSKTVIFVNQAGNDFHLDPTDVEARENGVDLGSPYMDFDIDNLPDGLFHIGADGEEGAAGGVFDKSLISGIMTQDARTSELSNIMS